MNAVVEHAGKQVTFCDANPKDYVEGMLLEGTWYELQNLEFIRSLQCGGTYVDIGAFIGTHSLFFSLFCPAEKVYSFEVNPRAYEKLRKNLAANNASNVHVYNLGLSDDVGGAVFHETNETNRGASFLKGNEGETFVAPLDSLLIPDVRLMKVDVEGMELRVLKGAVRTLKTVEHLFVEMWSEAQSKDRDSEYTAPQVVEFLAEQGLMLQRELASDRLYYFLRGGKLGELTFRSEKSQTLVWDESDQL